VTPEDLRKQTSPELKTQKRELEEEYFRLRVQKSVGQLEKTHRLLLVRRDIARVHTILREKEGQVS
jgi:large subunit ribosomal protein L29